MNRYMSKSLIILSVLLYGSNAFGAAAFKIVQENKATEKWQQTRDNSIIIKKVSNNRAQLYWAQDPTVKYGPNAVVFTFKKGKVIYTDLNGQQLLGRHYWNDYTIKKSKWSEKARKRFIDPNYRFALWRELFELNHQCRMSMLKKRRMK